MTTPDQNFWVELSQVTGIPSPKAKELQDIVKNAYIDDMLRVPKNMLSGEQQKSFMQPQSDKGWLKASVMPSTSTLLEDAKDIEQIRFGNIVIALPKQDMKKAWEKAKRMMDIYLEKTPTDAL